MHLAGIAGSLNPADIGTKRLPSSRLKSLMALLGMFNTTAAALEGSEDPGGIFQKKHRVLQILSVLGLTSLISLKGCDEDTTSNPSQMLVIFTLIFGFASLVFLRWFANMPHVSAAQEEPDAEPVVMDDYSGVDTTETAATATHETAGADATTRADTATQEPTADNYVAWMVASCSRRRDSTTCRHFALFASSFAFPCGILMCCHFENTWKYE